jgi:UDP-GlcNAc:undecaprenyl-phosphate GlcNAc-1-phosphate transferase
LLSPYLLPFVVSLLVTFGLTPIVRRLALRNGLVVLPDERKVHERPTPNVGGIAMIIGVLAALLAAWAGGGLTDVFDTPSAPLGVVAASSIIFLVGLLDELRKIDGVGVSAPAKLAGIVLAGGVLTLAGVSTVFFRVPFLGVFSLSPDLSSFVTVLWVAGMANALNFIDGLDGLAAGVTAIAAGSFFLYGLQLDNEGVLATGSIGPLLAVITLGICLGFLPWTFHPAKIFMGDCGALLLGLLMASSTIAVGGATDAEYSGQSFFFFAPLFIPLVILGVPILDTAFAIVRRATKRASPAAPDKEHLHHRLLRLGHGHRRSVLILWTWTALLSALVLVPAYTGRGNAVMPIVIFGLALLLFTIFHPGRRNGNGDGDDDDALSVSTPSDPRESSSTVAGAPIISVADEPAASRPTPLR